MYIKITALPHYHITCHVTASDKKIGIDKQRAGVRGKMQEKLQVFCIKTSAHLFLCFYCLLYKYKYNDTQAKQCQLRVSNICPISNKHFLSANTF